jgi:metal-responsive CopG/Arc/MetJ family transcriptional regulator
MSLRKAAVAVPVDLLNEIDRAARERRESRDRFVTRVLQDAVRARRDADITRRLDALFARPILADRHRREASELDVMGPSWTNERW